jgi:hypothetical protein
MLIYTVKHNPHPREARAARPSRLWWWISPCSFFGVEPSKIDLQAMQSDERGRSGEGVGKGFGDVVDDGWVEGCGVAGNECDEG